jgi:hypothetical protein
MEIRNIICCLPFILFIVDVNWSVFEKMHSKKHNRLEMLKNATIKFKLFIYFLILIFTI